jgi:hypothetical protein
MAKRPDADEPVEIFFHRLDQNDNGEDFTFSRPPRSGDPCPHCRTGRLDYDGLLNLACSDCGYVLAGCFS